MRSLKAGGSVLLERREVTWGSACNLVHDCMPCAPSPAVRPTLIRFAPHSFVSLPSPLSLSLSGSEEEEGAQG